MPMTCPHLVYMAEASSHLPAAHNRKSLIGIQESGMLTQQSGGMACRSQFWRCPGPIFGGLTLRRPFSSIGRVSAYFRGDAFKSSAATLGGKQYCSLSSPEVQPEDSQPEEKMEIKASRTTIYDSIRTERITEELFPDLNFPLDGNFYPKLVPLVAKKINTFLDEEDGLERTSELLEHLGLKLTPHILGEILKIQKDTAKADLVFEWAGSLPGFQYNAHTYKLKFWNLVSMKNDKAGNLVRALALLEEMKAKGITPGPLACNVLIDRLCKDSKVGAALNIMCEVDNGKDFPDLFTYNILIHGLSKAGMFSEVFELIEKMKERGLMPERVTYNSIIHGLGNAGRWQEAYRIFDEMPAKGITPGVVTYNSLISGLFKCRQVEEAYKVYGLMRLRGVEPDRITYNTLIDGLWKADRVEEAWKIFEYMQEKGCKPDVVTYNTLICGLNNAGNQEEALRLLAEMKEKRCKPNEFTFRLMAGTDPKKIADIFNQVESATPQSSQMFIRMDQLYQSGA